MRGIERIIMCRPKGAKGGARRCPSHSSKASISARNARRRATYASNKLKASGEQNSLEDKVTGSDGSGVELSSAVTEDSSQQSVSFSENPAFAQSIARDENGKLIKMYHCSEVDFDEFDAKFTGGGNDQYGSGFYFNPDLEITKAYGEYTHEVHLNLQNPMVITNGNMNDVTLDKQAVRKLLRSHPNAYTQPENDDDEYSILSDYSSQFWDKTEWTKPEMDKMLDDMADEYFSNEGNYNNLEIMFDEHTPIFRKSVHESTGYDGVIADLGEHGKHYIAWFPEQIQRIPKQG